MPVGDYPAGYGAAGADPGIFPTVSTVIPTGLAKRFDAATKSFLQDGAGGFQRVHPVDQKVAMALGLEVNGLASAPTIGNRFRQRLSRLAPIKKRAAAIDEIRIVLRRLLDARDIAILDVQVDSTVRGADIIAIKYANLRDADQVARSRAVSVVT